MFPTLIGRVYRNHGFTYLGLLIMIAIIGVTSAATLQVGSIAQRRAAEEELLIIGAAFQEALASYANAAPDKSQKTGPASLQDLLKDPRYPNGRRHLRKIYPDPITGTEEWGTVLSADGNSIIGIYSLSPAKPIKLGHFDIRFQGFEGKTSYRAWKFLAPTTDATVITSSS